MDNFDKKGFDYYVELIAKTFPVLTALTFIFGYIGFRTYTSIYHIPVVSADLSVIAGIGLLSLSCLGLIYLFASKKREPTFSSALFLFIILRFYFVGNPYSLASALGSMMIFFYIPPFHKIFESKGLRFSERRKKANQYFCFIRIVDIVFFLAALLFTIFLNENILFFSLVLLAALFCVHLYKRKRPLPFMSAALFLLLFPILTMVHIIDLSEENVLGLNKMPCSLISYPDTIKTKIVFSDDTYFYTFSDSTKLMTAYKKEDVDEIITLTHKTSSKGLVEAFVRK